MLEPSPARLLNWALLALCIAVLGSTLFISDRALVESDAPIAALLAESPDWEQRFQGKLETVFVRKTQGADSPASDGSSR